MKFKVLFFNKHKYKQKILYYVFTPHTKDHWSVCLGLTLPPWVFSLACFPSPFYLPTKYTEIVPPLFVLFLLPEYIKSLIKPSFVPHFTVGILEIHIYHVLTPSELKGYNRAKWICSSWDPDSCVGTNTHSVTLLLFKVIWELNTDWNYLCFLIDWKTEA